MPVSKSELFDIHDYGDQKRFKMRFTFDDGRELVRGPTMAPTLADAGTVLANEIPIINAKQARVDAKAAVDEDREIETVKEASPKDVLRQYLVRAMSADTVKAFRMFNKANAYIAAQGWTPAQVKAELEIPDKHWDRIKARNQFFNANTAVISAFAQLDDPEA
jgi:hypothetical protein